MRPPDAPRPEARPASPFLILLLGGASCALGAEWLRFQWGAWLAVPPAAAGGVVTLAAVARAYRARRRWRRRRALGDEAARDVPIPSGGDAPSDREPARVRTAPAQRPVPSVGSYDPARDAPLGAPAAEAGSGDARPERAPGDPGPDRERVGATRADADPRASPRD